jgi:hypothetical protein
MAQRCILLRSGVRLRLQRSLFNDDAIQQLSQDAEGSEREFIYTG